MMFAPALSGWVPWRRGCGVGVTAKPRIAARAGRIGGHPAVGWVVRLWGPACTR